MKHELEQVHIESYGLTGPEVVVAAAIKVYLMNLPWSDAKKKMDAVISLERGAVTVDGRTLSGLVNDSVEYALGAVGQKTELAPELWQTMEAQLKSVNGSVTVQTVATGLLDFLYDCWTSTKRQTLVTYSLHRPQKHPLEKKVQRWLMRAIFVYTPRL